MSKILTILLLGLSLMAPDGHGFSKKKKTPPPPPPPQTNSPKEVGFSFHLHIDRNPSIYQFSNPLNSNALISNAQELQGKVDWLRIYIHSWEFIKEIRTATSMEFDEATLEELKSTIQTVKNMGFKVQINTQPPAAWPYQEPNQPAKLSEVNASQFENVIKPMTQTYFNRIARDLSFVDAWQIINEGNWRHYLDYYTAVSDPNNNIWPSDELLRQIRGVVEAARTEIRSFNPSAKILSNTAHWPMGSNSTYRTNVKNALYKYHANLRDLIDIVAVDIYPLVGDRNVYDDSKTSGLTSPQSILVDEVNALRDQFADKIFSIEETGKGCNTDRATDATTMINWFAKSKANRLIYFQYQDYRPPFQDPATYTCENQFGIRYTSDAGQTKPSYNDIMTPLGNARTGKIAAAGASTLLLSNQNNWGGSWTRNLLNNR